MLNLVKGEVYDISVLELIGWTPGDGSDAVGYICWDYFDPNGRYHGPDAYGIEPLFDHSVAIRAAYNAIEQRAAVHGDIIDRLPDHPLHQSSRRYGVGNCAGLPEEPYIHDSVLVVASRWYDGSDFGPSRIYRAAVG